MITLATIFFVLGVLLIVGPTVLSYFLGACSAIVPASWPTTVLLMSMMLINMLIFFLFRVTLLSDGNDEKKRKKARKTKFFGRIIMVMHFSEVVIMILIILNGPLTIANDGWKSVMSENSDTFSTLIYVGIVMIALAIGIFLGKRHKEDAQLSVVVEGDSEDKVDKRRKKKVQNGGRPIVS